MQAETLSRALALVFGGMMLAGSPLAQGARPKGPLPGQGVDWRGEWEASLEEASARNVPLLFYVGQDG